MAQAKTCGRAGRSPGWLPERGRRGRTAPRLSHHPGVHCRGISRLRRLGLFFFAVLDGEVLGRDLLEEVLELRDLGFELVRVDVLASNSIADSSITRSAAKIG